MSDSAEQDPLDQLAATGERLVPERQAGELVLAEHMARYLWASAYVEGKTVLDAASGAGYGTDLLATAGAASVTGVDVSAEAVKHATHRYGHKYVQADVADMPLADDSVDVVVSFETIEHVDDAGAVIDEFVRVLRPGGVLVISTPNKLEYTVDNEFHAREFTPDEFAELLSARFAHVRTHLQQNWLTSVVGDADAATAHGPTGVRLDGEFYWEGPPRPGKELYTVAVCSNEQLHAPPRQIGFLSGVYEAHEMAVRLVDAEKSMWGWHERATEAERLVDKWHERATEAERQVEYWRERGIKYERVAKWFPWNAWPKAVRRLRDRRARRD